MELKDSVAVITGSGSGIGRALAIEFAKNGAKVVCCGRRKERLDQTIKMIKDIGGIGISVPTDITQKIQVQNLVQTTLREFNQIDILFNNAGSFQSIAGVHEADPDTWWWDVTVNLYGSFLMIRYILPHMLKRNSGIIINMNGGRPVGGTGYAAGKAGLMELTRILAEELKILKSNVMVFSAGPGLVKTEMTQYQVDTEAGRKWIPSTKESFEKGRTRSPEEIAQATIKLITLAKPEWSGKSYGPDTDFSKF